MDEQWREKAETGMDVLAAAMMSGHLGVYPAVLDGMDVLVVSYLSPQEGAEDRFTGKPLAILWSDELHNRIDVPHGTVVRG